MSAPVGLVARQEQPAADRYERLADAVARAVDVAAVAKLAGLSFPRS
jgi:hypothetical protein